VTPLPPRLWWLKRRLRDQPVPADGRPLSVYEEYGLEMAEFAVRDDEGTRRVALEVEAAEMAAAGEEWVE